MSDMNIDQYHYRITWSADENQHIGLCTEFPSLSWLAKSPEEASAGIRQVVSEAIADMQSTGEPIPVPQISR